MWRGDCHSTLVRWSRMSPQMLSTNLFSSTQVSKVTGTITTAPTASSERVEPWHSLDLCTAEQIRPCIQRRQCSEKIQAVVPNGGP